MSSRREVPVEVEGKRIALANLDKVLYPATGFTNGDVIDYYRRVAPALLPHLRDRPLTLKRYPEGVRGPYFYEKRCPSHRPSWVRTAAVETTTRGTIQFCVVDDLATLVWAANLADLELHCSLHRASRPKRPTALVFDLGSGAPADVVECCEVALLLRRAPRPLGPPLLGQDLGIEGAAGVRATRWPGELPRGEGLCAGLGRDLGPRAAGARRGLDAQGFAGRQGARRLEPKRCP